ncbi:hypothetical protein T439DRAFT_375756 [Meredithblackwellia eburnea MCA 4105]
MTSLSSSTTSILHTPSPADRRPFRVLSASLSANQRNPFSTPPASSIARQPPPNGQPPTNNGASTSSTQPSGPTSSSSILASSSTTTKAVRFSPATTSNSHSGASIPSSFHPSPAQSTSLVPGKSPAAPASRVQAVQHQSSPIPGPPSPFNASSSSSLPSSATATLLQGRKSKSVAHSTLTGGPRLGRGEVAKRLRVNACLLVFCWISCRTHIYSFASGHLVQLFPSLDAPLHFLESSILLLLFYNIADSMYRLNGLSSLPPSALSSSSSKTPSPRRSPTISPQKSVFPSNVTGTPVGAMRSSPKTRPSPSMSPSPIIPRSTSLSSLLSTSSTPSTPASPFRHSSVGLSTPQTPSAQPRLSSGLRRTSSGLTTGGSLSGPGSGSGSGSGSIMSLSSSGIGGTEEKERALIEQFRVRHEGGRGSPVAMGRIEGIERLLD